MRISFLPKEYKFFDMFDELASMAVTASRYFRDLTLSGKFDEESVHKMRTIENQADEVTHDIINKLNLTFITPFDREDIHSLAHQLDGVIDNINTIVNRMRLYNLQVINNDLIHFAEVIEKSVAALEKAVNGLRNIKKSDQILEYCIEVNRLENVGDQLRDNVIGALFDNQHDPIYIIKWKEIFSETETVLDQCEDVANIVQSIMVKQA